MCDARPPANLQTAPLDSELDTRLDRYLNLYLCAIAGEEGAGSAGEEIKSIFLPFVTRNN